MNTRPSQMAVLSTIVFLAQVLFGGCERAEPPSSTAEPVPPAAPPSRPPRQPPAGFLPYPEILGWVMSRDSETHNSDQLSRLVGEEAASYRRFGCVSAATTEYRNAEVPDVVLRLEIFDMGSRLKAFGLLAQEISSFDDPALAEAPGVLEIREAGIIGPGRLTFFRGQYLLHLQYRDHSSNTSAESLETGSREHLPPIARQLSRIVPGQSELPEELALLPRLRRVRRSERYDPDHLMSLPWLGAGICSLYGDPGPRYRVGVLVGLDEEGARQALESSMRGLEHAEVLEEQEDLGEAAIRGRRGDDTVIVVREGDTLAVAQIEGSQSAPRISHVIATLSAVFNPRPEDHRPPDPRPWRRPTSRKQGP